MSGDVPVAGLDLDAIARRWSTNGGMGNERGADTYDDKGCRILAGHGFADVGALVAAVRAVLALADEWDADWKRAEHVSDCQVSTDSAASQIRAAVGAVGGQE